MPACAFEPRLALASLSGESDAAWARKGEDYAGLALLGGIALDEPTREAARASVRDRDRTEFLPDEPFAFVADELERAGDADLDVGFNVRAVSREPIERVAHSCAERDAWVEVNAHCRQEEMCAAGAGESLLQAPTRLSEFVSAASDTGATTSVKVRAEVEGVDLPELARELEAAGADALHVDAMDSEDVLREVRDAVDCFLIANNGVRDERTVTEYFDYGADAVSVGRPSDDPRVLGRVNEAVTGWWR